MCCLLRPGSCESNMKDLDLTSGEQNLGVLWPESDSHCLTWWTDRWISWLWSVCLMCFVSYSWLVLSKLCAIQQWLYLRIEKRLVSGLWSEGWSDQTKQNKKSSQVKVRTRQPMVLGGCWLVWGAEEEESKQGNPVFPQQTGCLEGWGARAD